MRLPLFLPTVLMVNGEPQRFTWNDLFDVTRHTVIAVIPSTHTPV